MSLLEKIQKVSDFVASKKNTSALILLPQIRDEVKDLEAKLKMEQDAGHGAMNEVIRLKNLLKNSEQSESHKCWLCKLLGK